MAMNKIQFQAGLSLHEFLHQYGTEAQCEAALFAARWPHGWRCLRCDGERYSCTHNGRKLWECLDCGYQCSSIVGTVFENTKLPLRTWFLAIYLMTQSKNAVSALELKRQLGVSYKTAWSIKHKLLQTMLLREEQRRLDGRVEVDDAYLGGERPGKRGRGAASKTPFVAAIQTNSEGKPLYIRLTPVAGFTYEALKQWSAECLSSTARVVSDGLGCFGAVTHTAAQHERHIVGSGKSAVQRAEFRWVNTLLGNLKTAFSGTYHAFNHAKYAQRYLAEFSYRFNRRFDLAAMVPRLLRAAATTEPLPIGILRISEIGN
ncbi:IS1595 family transposase [Nitrosomonas mobilis]|uniref:Transposase n=5 Tax=Nitrosomonas mobilis TaxID=51642 RepID=A0A1G5SJU6_9PROT|nr:IS1595 family transposase [Nitrosomonas mobilis]SCZ84617.1 transposase [Nitrosomonas mobilis]SCZ86639.1 transposase [Nitrosomonas mobilis]SCZ86946.1 transposase [Nitrosomonas mobilis]SCZ87169.1 transposase [Nitrosomonas mobilis]